MLVAFVFLLLVYGSTWALNLTLRTAAGDGSSEAMFTFLFGTVWAPTVAALVLALIFGGRASVSQLLHRLFSMPQGTRWIVAAAIVPFAVVSLGVLVANALGDSAPRPDMSLWPSIIGLQIITGAVGEELGWRGFLLPNLARHVGFTIASVLGGLLWSAWHIAGLVFPGTGLDIVPPILFLIFATLFGVFLAFLFARTGHVIAPMLAHLSVNVALPLSGTPGASQAFWWVVILAMGTVVAVVALKAWPDENVLEPTATTGS